MITDAGRTHIKRFLSSQVSTLAQCIAYGIGNNAEDPGDTELRFEVGRAPITVVSYDFVDDKIIFKAVLSDDFSASIREVALFSQLENPVAGNFGSKILASFDSVSETWTNSADASSATFTTADARLGGDSLSLTPAVSSSVGFTLNDVLYDLSQNSGADIFKLAYNVGSNVSSVSFRMRTDASNYYSFTASTPAAGYRIDSFTKGSAVVTGNPSWENITSIEVRVTASAGGAAAVDFDGIRIEDTDSINPEYVMVAREVLLTPFAKTEGRTQEVEFSLGVVV